MDVSRVLEYANGNSPFDHSDHVHESIENVNIHLHLSWITIISLFDSPKGFIW